jgi:tetratricopeptide (TPR) repeat protein
MHGFFTMLVLAAPAAAFPTTPLKPAVEAARAENRLVVAEFWTFNAEPSRSYAQKILSQPPVMAWVEEHARGARVNADFNRKLSADFHVQELPTLLVMDSTAQVWGRITGPRRPEEIVKELGAILADREAFAEAQKALAAKPDDAAALAKLVTGFIRQEKPKEAEEALLRLRAADPTGAVACHEALAFAIADAILEPRRNIPEAIRLFKVAADWAERGKKEIRENALFRLANLKLLEGDFSAAAKLLELLLAESPRFPDRSKALYVLGLVYVRDLKDKAKGKTILLDLAKHYADRFSVAAEKLLESIALEEQ